MEQPPHPVAKAEARSRLRGEPVIPSISTQDEEAELSQGRRKVRSGEWRAESGAFRWRHLMQGLASSVGRTAAKETALRPLRRPPAVGRKAAKGTADGTSRSSQTGKGPAGFALARLASSTPKKARLVPGLGRVPCSSVLKRASMATTNRTRQGESRSTSNLRASGPRSNDFSYKSIYFIVLGVVKPDLCSTPKKMAEGLNFCEHDQTSSLVVSFPFRRDNPPQ
jgi:hypothetical protein